MDEIAAASKEVQHVTDSINDRILIKEAHANTLTMKTGHKLAYSYVTDHTLASAVR